MKDTTLWFTGFITGLSAMVIGLSIMSAVLGSPRSLGRESMCMDVCTQRDSEGLYRGGECRCVQPVPP